MFSRLPGAFSAANIPDILKPKLKQLSYSVPQRNIFYPHQFYDHLVKSVFLLTLIPLISPSFVSVRNFDSVLFPDLVDEIFTFTFYGTPELVKDITNVTLILRSQINPGIEIDIFTAWKNSALKFRAHEISNFIIFVKFLLKTKCGVSD